MSIQIIHLPGKYDYIVRYRAGEDGVTEELFFFLEVCGKSYLLSFYEALDLQQSFSFLSIGRVFFSSRSFFIMSMFLVFLFLFSIFVFLWIYA